MVRRASCGARDSRRFPALRDLYQPLKFGFGDYSRARSFFLFRQRCRTVFSSNSLLHFSAFPVAAGSGNGRPFLSLQVPAVVRSANAILGQCSSPDLASPPLVSSAT